MRAFSLVELSIVLVILGLLTGGILAGQSLIRAAELRDVTNDFQRYSTATYTFRDKYMALPGDMTNAIQFWGTANNDPATCATTSTGDMRTCNGNGDGNITAATISNEQYRFWQHLANAGLVAGTYSGINGPSATVTYDSVVGQNIPASRISNAGWAMHSAYTETNPAAAPFLRSYSLRLMFGRDIPDGTVRDPALTAQELWSIDSKIDDGKPGLGRIISTKGSYSGCATSDDYLTAEYALTTPGTTCAIIGQPGF